MFTTRTGRPIEPRNLVRSFRRICDQNKIRVITIHHSGAHRRFFTEGSARPTRDAQAILGHTRISTTLKIYTDSAPEARRNALSKLDDLLGPSQH